MTRDDLIISHMALAERIAKRYHYRGYEKEDLISIAYLGLIDAADRYKPSKGEFAHYAQFRIKGFIVDYVRASSLVRRSKSNVTLTYDNQVQLEIASPDRADTYETREILEKLLPVLSRKELQTIHSLYIKELNHADLASEGCGCTRISQIRTSSLKKMRKRAIRDL